MDILERVREIGQDVLPLTDAKLDEARQKLLHETARKQRIGMRNPVRRRVVSDRPQT
jgi:hypothetical protein